MGNQRYRGVRGDHRYQGYQGYQGVSESQLWDSGEPRETLNKQTTQNLQDGRDTVRKLQVTKEL